MVESGIISPSVKACDITTGILPTTICGQSQHTAVCLQTVRAPVDKQRLVEFKVVFSAYITKQIKKVLSSFSLNRFNSVR